MKQQTTREANHESEKPRSKNAIKSQLINTIKCNKFYERDFSLIFYDYYNHVSNVSVCFYSVSFSIVYLYTEIQFHKISLFHSIFMGFL